VGGWWAEGEEKFHGVMSLAARGAGEKGKKRVNSRNFKASRGQEKERIVSAPLTLIPTRGKGRGGGGGDRGGGDKLSKRYRKERRGPTPIES